MKVYIAGKITGDPDYRAKFFKAAKYMESMGFAVLNPATLPEGMSRNDYMSICLPMLLAADAIALLPDYGKSVGATIEHQIARYTEKEVIVLEEGKSGYAFFIARPAEIGKEDS